MSALKPVFRFITKPFRRLRVWLKQRAGWMGIPMIVAYRGFGNCNKVFIQGMVMEDKGLSKPGDYTRFWQNMLATVKRFSGDEIPGVRVRVSFHDMAVEAETDEYGFFNVEFELPEAEKPASGWYDVEYELLDNVVEDQPKITAEGQVLLIAPATKRIIVSDIDDTVLVSHSTQTLRKLRLMLLKNAASRTPFPGVPEFYSALGKGLDNKSDFPFFYVSSSEWNLYDLLEDFFRFNELPKGIFLLRKLEHSIWKFWKSGQGNHEHKYEKISSLITFYPDQKFILIGDSGQRDPEIYRRLAIEFPGRIESIYIRKIRSKVSFDDMKSVHEALKAVDTGYLEVEDTSEAVEHARRNGYIV